MKTDIYSLLKHYYGYDEFRPLQKEIIEDVLAKKDVFVLMPTGGGKSLCYQIPAVAQDGLTIVVSPLISLMKDQVDGLIQNGIAAAYYNSLLSSSEKREIEGALKQNQLSILYVAPERLMQDSFLSMLQNLEIAVIAIDEAHCISEWGHDFRPEYRKLTTLKSLFPNVPIIALTATATERVKEDIINQLNLPDAKKYQASFNRANLSYHVFPKYDGLTQTIEFLKKHADESGIIYCQSRESVDRTAEILRLEGFKVLPYHAGLPDMQRKENQEKFIKEDVDIIVATIAFGMGIDKPNVRFVLHLDLPSTIERYYQETGRAGRDGLPSECLLLFSPGDKEKIRYFINQKVDPKERKIAEWQLKKILQFAQCTSCRRSELLSYFGEHFDHDNCQACDNCLTPKETFDATEVTQKILSCVYRVHERFGMLQIARILTGSKVKQVMQNNHDKLSTFGIVKDYSMRNLQQFMQELIHLGYLQQTDGKYPLLTLTEKSWSVLKENQKVILTQPEIPMSAEYVRTEDQADVDEDLFNKLRILRKSIADREGIPPYLIFPDTTLKEMASIYPQSKEQLSFIKGVGEQKLRSYGELFMDEILKYCLPRELDYKGSTRIRKVKRPTLKKTPIFKETLSLFNSGLSIEEIAQQRNVKTSTITSHLEEAYIQGEEFDIDLIVSQEKQEIITRAFEKFGLERLSPVKFNLGDNYSYDEIRLTRAKLLRNSRI